MSWLGTAVQWAALFACGLSVVGYFRDRRARAEARIRQHEAEAEAHARAVQAAYDRGHGAGTEEANAHVDRLADELAQCRDDRRYWRDIVVRRASSEQERGPRP